MNAGERLFRLPSDPDKEEAVNVSWVTVPTSLSIAKFWDELLPSEFDYVLAEVSQYDC